MLKLRALFPAVVSVLLLTACPITDPPLPTPYDYVGTWSGTLSDSVGGEGNVTFEVIAQSDLYGGALDGSWTADFGGTANSGILRSDYAYEKTLNASLISSKTPDCVYNLNTARTEKHAPRHLLIFWLYAPTSRARSS